MDFPYGTGVIDVDPEYIRREDAQKRLFSGRVKSLASKACNILAIGRIRYQSKDPSCIGHMGASNAEALVPDLTFIPSGKSTWLDSQRFWILNAEPDPTQGSFPYCAFLSIIKHGLYPYREGEDGASLSKAGWSSGKHKKACWESVATAYDNRVISEAKRYRIDATSERILEIRVAIDCGFGVGICVGLHPPIVNYRADESTGDRVLDTVEFGGKAGLHAMRVAGYRLVGDGTQFLLENFWGEGWGGARLPSGKWQKGCCWVTEQVLIDAHDIWVMDFSKKQ